MQLEKRDEGTDQPDEKSSCDEKNEELPEEMMQAKYFLLKQLSRGFHDTEVYRIK